MKNIHKIILVLFAIIVLFLSVFFIFRLNKENTGMFRTAVINGTRINLEVARTDREVALGLGNRDKLESDKGLLFIFSRSDYYNFWMKDMRFPIDIIWIQDDIIVDISKNVPLEPGVTLEKLKLYQPRRKANRVLEVNAGFADKNNIKTGNRIQFVY